MACELYTQEAGAMMHGDGFFKGVRDVQIYYQYWLPEGDPRAALLIVHGLGEHGGRYRSMAEYLVPRGYAIYTLDLPGHGRSGGKRMYVERFADLTVPLDTYLGMVRAWQPDLPLFLFGHSLGGLIAICFVCVADNCEEHQAELAGAVFSGPSVVVPDNVSAATILAGKVLSALVPWAGVVDVVPPAKLSHDADVVQAYRDDPLVFRGKIPARLGAEVLRAQQQAMERASQISLPVLIMHGGADSIVPPEGSRRLYPVVGSVDKHFQIYEGLYHETFNEPERDRVLADLAAWLDAHIPQGA
jgi:acylglycerol lipase